MLKQCNCELVEHSFDVVAEGQMKTCPQRIGAYNKILETLKMILRIFKMRAIY